MRVKKIDIIHRFLPLAWHTFFIIFIAFHMTKDGLNIIVDAKYNYLIYLDIALGLAFFIAETYWARKIISKWRISFFLLFMILAVSIPPLMGDWQLFNTFIVISSGLEVLLIMLKMVKDSLYSEERLQNQKLPINQFTDKRKLVSRIVYIISFVLLFVISFIVFYYNEVSLEALVILCFVGIIIVSIGSIIRLSISLKPMQKYIKKFQNNLDLEALEKNILGLDEPKLHDETRNMMYIELWHYASFINLDKAIMYEGMTFQPKDERNLNRYNDALFWFLLNSKKYELIKVREAVFKKLPNKKKLLPYLGLINGEEKKIKFKKKLNKYEELKKNLYFELKQDLLNLKSKKEADIEEVIDNGLNFKVAIMYESITGNTKMIAKAIKEALGPLVIYEGHPNLLVNADLYFIGSWVDCGNENNNLKFIRDIKNKKIAIFGTSGYLTNEYAKRLYERIIKNIDASNTIYGCFYSLGKMRLEAKENFVSIIKNNPLDKDLDVNISDFDLNQSHPDQSDLYEAKIWASYINKEAKKQKYKKYRH